MTDKERINQAIATANIAASIATQARADITALKSLCAMLLVEIARRDADPELALEKLLARTRHIPAKARHLAVDQTAFIDDLILLAEADYDEAKSRMGPL